MAHSGKHKQKSGAQGNNDGVPVSASARAMRKKRAQNKANAKGRKNMGGGSRNGGRRNGGGK